MGDVLRPPPVVVTTLWRTRIMFKKFLIKF